MKRYEKPIVELTKFNAEDIIATSLSTTDAANADIVINAIKDNKATAKDGGNFDASGSFLNW